MIRCGLGPPEVPSRVLEGFVRDFGSEGSQQPISHGYISSVRDAFAEILIHMNRKHISQVALEAHAVIVSHIHDEASMRMRSVKEQSQLTGARGMSTKVQNNVMTAVFLTDKDSHKVSVLLELQPLTDKTAQTITHTLRLAMDELLNAALQHRSPKLPKLRVIHSLTGAHTIKSAQDRTQPTYPNPK